jgi:hypothetical protein
MACRDFESGKGGLLLDRIELTSWNYVYVKRALSLDTYLVDKDRNPKKWRQSSLKLLSTARFLYKLIPREQKEVLIREGVKF